MYDVHSGVIVNCKRSSSSFLFLLGVTSVTYVFLLIAAKYFFLYCLSIIIACSLNQIIRQPKLIDLVKLITQGLGFLAFL